jgi:hypothetical protein
MMIAGATVATCAGATFIPGNVFWSEGTGLPTHQVVNATAGGDLSSTTPLATIGRAPGQLAWSADLTTMYVPEFDNDRVLAVSATGTTTVFATGISGPTGLIRTSDSRLLAVSFFDGTVIDITAGGNFAGAGTFALGFTEPRNLLQLANGEILLADQVTNRVMNITAGGDFSASAAFADGFSTKISDLVQDASGRIFVSNWESNRVFDITGGGNFSSASPFATGRTFNGLTFDGQGRLLASVSGSTSIYDITAGGNFSSAPAFATGLPGAGDSGLDTVPVPEPGVAALAAMFSAACVSIRRRRTPA